MWDFLPVCQKDLSVGGMHFIGPDAQPSWMYKWSYPRRTENANSEGDGSFPLVFQSFSFFFRVEFLECDYFGSSLPEKKKVKKKIIRPSSLAAADSIYMNREELEEHKCSTFTHAKYSNFFFKSLSKLSSLFQLHWQQRVSFVLNQLSEWVTFTEAAGTCQNVSFCPWIFFFLSRSFAVRIRNLL